MSEFRLITKRGATADRPWELPAREAMSPARYRELHEGTFEPPDSARTFKEYDFAAASRLASNRPHVIIRDDPMFGRRGYAKEVIADPKHGFVVLVIAFTARKDHRGDWQEPIKPRDCDRQYWPPGKVEFAPR